MPNKKEIIKLKEGGLTYQEIGLKFGVSRQRIHQIITGYRDNNFMQKYMKKLRAKKRQKKKICTCGDMGGRPRCPIHRKNPNPPKTIGVG